MPKVRMCTPSLIEPVVMVTGPEISNWPLAAALGRLGKFCANKHEGFTFCIMFDVNWIVFRPKQVQLLVEHFKNKL